jgi:hypothetical protein
VLLVISANPFAFFYDALLLAIPATVWWAERDRWSRNPWLIVGWLIALMWCSEQWLYSWGVVTARGGVPWRPPVSIVGLSTAIWLILVGREAMRAPDGHPVEIG